MRMKVPLLVVALSVFAMSGLTCPEDCEPGDPNLAVDRIDFTLVTQASPTTGTVRIDGVVENKGGSTFDSGAGQQSVQLYEGTAITPVAQQNFEDLAVGATVTVSYTLDWTTSTEFPPTYRVYINLDPDIFIDGNPNNDDCPTVDNAMERPGSDINDLF